MNIKLINTALFVSVVKMFKRNNFVTQATTKRKYQRCCTNIHTTVSVTSTIHQNPPLYERAFETTRTVSDVQVSLLSNIKGLRTNMPGIIHEWINVALLIPYFGYFMVIVLQVYVMCFPRSSYLSTLIT